MRHKINSLLFYVVLPIILFVYGVLSLFGYLKSTEFGALSLDVNNLTQYTASTSGELLKGDTIKGKFHSNYKNLGIVSLRFNNQNRDSKDTLVFRIKEEGGDKWLYEAKYETNQFQPGKLFPFGFPNMDDSEAKDYMFELESLNGATGSGILIDYKKPFFVARSVFTKSELLSNKHRLVYFVGKKIMNIFGDDDYKINTFSFFLPLFFYVVYLISNGFSFHLLTAILLAIMCWDIFYLGDSYDSLFVAIIFLWGLISCRYKFEARISALFAIILLIFTPIYLIINQQNVAEKIAVWSYLFLCITLIQHIYEFKTKQKKLFFVKDFCKNIYKIKIPKNNIFTKYPKLIALISIVISGLFTYSIFNNIYNVINSYINFFP